MHKSHRGSETSHFSFSLGGGLAADDIYRQRALTDDTYRQRALTDDTYRQRQTTRTSSGRHVPSAADDTYRQRALTDDTYRQRRDLVVDAHTDGRRELIFLLAGRLQQTEAELDLYRVLLNAGRAQLPAAAAATVPHKHVMEISTAAARGQNYS